MIYKAAALPLYMLLRDTATAASPLNSSVLTIKKRQGRANATAVSTASSRKSGGDNELLPPYQLIEPRSPRNIEAEQHSQPPADAIHNNDKHTSSVTSDNLDIHSSKSQSTTMATYELTKQQLRVFLATKRRIHRTQVEEL